jgi:hypothetical protein
MGRKTRGYHEEWDGSDYRPVRDRKGRIVVTEQGARQGSLDFEGTTKRRFGLGDSIRTLRSGR